MSSANLTTAQFTAFRSRLATRRRRLLGRLGSERVVEPLTIHLVGCTAERDVDRLTFDWQRKQVAEIEAALQRLDEGAFGVCTHCGNSIAIGRLEAEPATRLCRDCVATRPSRTLDLSGMPIGGDAGW